MSEALMLMGIGMGTVLVALLLVILLCKVLILVVNRFWPEKSDSIGGVGKVAAIPSGIIAAITAGVASASGGRAKIIKIERAENQKK